MDDSKYWSEMYISNSEVQKSDGFIVSTDPPTKYDGNKKITLSYDIDESEYDEICSFYEKYNRMSTGNTTLLPISELTRYMSYDNISVVMRSQNNNKLMGVIISIVLPIKNTNERGSELITHGCTTFLNVHPAVRGHGMCMALIRGLIERGYEKGIYCDYHTVHFKIGDNSIPLNCYYRPINLKRSIELGFLYPDCNDIRKNTLNRLRYSTNLPTGCSYVRVDDNITSSLEYYRESVKDKKFAFYPDESLWKQWIEGFPTYIIYHNNVEVGIVSLNTLYCVISSTGNEGRIATSVICNGKMKLVLPTLIHITNQSGYDVFYFHQYGDVTANDLESIHCIKTDHTMWFSLYNNKIKIEPSDLSVPLL